MRRISSDMTFFYKRIFPLFFIGGAAILFYVMAATSLKTGQPPFPVLIVPAVIVLFGFYIMRKMVFDLVDSVADAGDALLVRNGRVEERIPLADIINIGYSAMANPPRVTLTLRQPSAIFGKSVTFCAPRRWLPFAPSPIVDELIERVDAARRGAKVRTAS